jgi:hypothetical protein
VDTDPLTIECMDLEGFLSFIIFLVDFLMLIQVIVSSFMEIQITLTNSTYQIFINVVIFDFIFEFIFVIDGNFIQ